MPVAIGDDVPTGSCVSKEVNELTFVTTNDPLYWDWSAPVIVIDLSTLRPCLLLLVTVAIPDVWS